ncbi:pilus assembly protein PilM [Pantoea allii]|uniref:pilus assembly protein PilM n=1 Tax=Pantoea allii TaxID=574096 RepID=UPI0024B803C5|nr:pilus assembly protein PilM [Pantoea allii]MDJ0037817.1 pilus assembly protein PilM [Pantoea allii]MDJ0041524.1 pilus assembly protein PilM [Pantoea allii]
MAFHTWQIGLDIQNRQCCALAILRRRQGWQLCHWWQQRLAQDTLRNGVLQSSPELLSVLDRWRKCLPQRYSLRVGLPAQLVLQQPLSLPEPPLKEPALSRFVRAAAQRLFPVDPRELALDYRLDPAHGQLCVTAARLDVVKQWHAPLAQAGLKPSVFELATQALNIVTEQAQLTAGSVVVLRQDARYLWSDGINAASFADEGGLPALHKQAFPQASRVFYCDADSVSSPAGTVPFSPLQLLRYPSPPLPDNPAAFVLATGLALRQEDR